MVQIYHKELYQATQENEKLLRRILKPYSPQQNIICLSTMLFVFTE